MLRLRLFASVIAAFILASCASPLDRMDRTATSAAATSQRGIGGSAAPPKLILVLVVDGLPQEQLLKNYDLFEANGFRRLMDQGAWYSDAHQGHAFTVTAVGHAAVLSGAHPYQHGVIGNDWRERSGKYMYCTADERHSYLDGSPTGSDDGTSPRNLRVSTLGDELKYATNDKAKVFAVAGKDRGSILLAGKSGTAYMYMSNTGNFSSTSYYMKAHPEWVTKYQAAKPQDKYFKKAWEPLLPPEAYQRSVPDGQPYSSSFRKLGTRFGIQYGLALPAPNEVYYSQLLAGPYGDEITADFSLALLDNENLGRNPAGVADILGISFSSHDYINHNFGPESMQSQDHLIRLDRTLGKFLDAVDQRIGRDNVLIVLTADHGFMNVPEYSAARQFDAGRIDSSDMRAAANKTLEEKFGLPKLITQTMTGGATLDYAAAEAKGIAREALEQAAMRALQSFPGINFVFTRSQLEAGNMPDTRIGKLVTRAWDRRAAIDLVIVQKPFHFFQSKTSNTIACSHGTPYHYDTNVPLMLQGSRWIKPGRITRGAEVVDIAPTLAAVLNIRAPTASEGRVLSEILVGEK